MNSIFSKYFIQSFLYKQNKHHRHGVFLHTLRVVYYTLKNKDYKLVPAAFYHDFGKPFVAYEKEEDIINNEFSFTDHEEKSYQIIKNWFFLSDYTKEMVRYHYLIRDIHKANKKGDVERYTEKKAIWDNLPNSYHKDLRRFLKYDDLGKGMNKTLKDDFPSYNKEDNKN